MRLKFATNWKCPKTVCPIKQYGIATLGTFKPVHKDDLKRYVRMFEIAWIEA